MMTATRDRLATALMLLVLTSTAHGQWLPVRWLECQDRHQVHAEAGELTANNELSRKGVGLRVMVTALCEPNSRDGIEVGYMHIGYAERNEPSFSPGSVRIRGDALSTSFVGAVTERTPGMLPLNLRFVLGVGVYHGGRREMSDDIYNDPQYGPQHYRFDYRAKETSVGGSLGLSIGFALTQRVSLHAEARQHYSTPSGSPLLFSAGLRF